jgi:hypothetical protein
MEARPGHAPELEIPMPTNITPPIEPQQHWLTDLRAAEELGSQVRKITALLRAAINTGAGEEEDEGWLVSIAHDVAEEASATLEAWEKARSGEAN